LQTDSSNVDLLTYAGHAAINAAAKSSADKTKAAGFYQTAANYYGKVFAAKDTATEASVLQNLILSDIQLGKKDEAVAIGAKAVAAKPKDAAVWGVYATALQSADKSAEALAALDTLAKLDPTNNKLALRRAQALLGAKRLDDAKQAFQAAIAAGTDADEAAQAVFVEGFDRYRANEWDTALNYFAVSRDLGKSDKMKGQANFWSGMIYYQRGIPVAKTQTPKAAREALPLFQHALDYFQGNGVDAYAAATPGVKLGATISAVKQYIDIENQIIKRGK
jgi:tetratricopeptide (TPR) repeat protein